jgi:hypothetical protein
MAKVEQRLGRPPRFGAFFDAAFDAFYVYEYFYNAQGFAAVPLVAKGKCKRRSFSEEDCLCARQVSLCRSSWSTRTERPICTNISGANMPVPCFSLRIATRPAQSVARVGGRGGCTTTMTTSIGARLRYTLDRESADYKEIYKQRTATERINSQAKELGIERHILRNEQAITNLNSLIYMLINLRALQHLRKRLFHSQLLLSWKYLSEGVTSHFTCYAFS